MDDSAKKRISVCFTIDESYAQHLCVAISSMLKNNSKVIFSIYVFSFGISRRVEASIRAVFQNITNQELSFIRADKNLVADFKITGHASPVNYLRLFVADLLPQLNKILYLDCDIIVRSSLVDLYDTDIATYLFAAVPHQTLERSSVLGLKDEDYFNSGVLLLNLAKWRNENATEPLCNFVLQHPSKIHYWDQDALNAVYHNRYFKLDEKWNFVDSSIEPSELATLDVRIVHFAGMHKPWSPYSTHSLKEEYFSYLKFVELKDPMWTRWKNELLKPIKFILDLVKKMASFWSPT